jgi:hypothetical protein
MLCSVKFFHKTYSPYRVLHGLSETFYLALCLVSRSVMILAGRCRRNRQMRQHFDALSCGPTRRPRSETTVRRGDEVKITGDLSAANPRRDPSVVSRGVFSTGCPPQVLVHGGTVYEAPVSDLRVFLFWWDDRPGSSGPASLVSHVLRLRRDELGQLRAIDTGRPRKKFLCRQFRAVNAQPAEASGVRLFARLTT